ncbi:MAG: MATE family efflux transporter [Ruminococcus sp.]|nr:MATE family efflux transporter [Ruminococcus sp.]
MENDSLFVSERPGKALAKMALPTVFSQVIILIYNLADTWFIGRTDDPYKIAASSLGLTVYLAAVALANVFGVGGGTLTVRLIGEKKEDDARRTAAYTMSSCFIAALVFSLLTLVLSEPLLTLLGATDNTMGYAKEYLLTTSVCGGIPTVLSMCMPQLLRNSGYAKSAGFGVMLGSLINIALDPLFMFVLLPSGKEVLGAGIATAISNVISMVFFIVMFCKVKDKSVLSLPKRHRRIEGEFLRSFYSVGIPAAIAIFMFDLVTIVINRLTVSYSDIDLAAMGIVLKLERLPINIGLGVCLGMVPLVCYNFGAGNFKRMNEFVRLARIAILVFSAVCAAVFFIFPEQVVGLFINDKETVRLGGQFLRGRCLSLPFMMIGYHVVNYMNAVNQGKVSFLLAIIRHLVLIIPIMLLMNLIFGLDGLVWSQLVADAINALVAYLIFLKVSRRITSESR